MLAVEVFAVDGCLCTSVSNESMTHDECWQLKYLLWLGVNVQVSVIKESSIIT